MATRKVKLIPPDLNRCQAERKTGCWPDAQRFMVIGPAGWERCGNAPEVISTEIKPGKDGQRGSMSLCAACQIEMIKQMGAGFATFTPIKKGGK